MAARKFFVENRSDHSHGSFFQPHTTCPLTPIELLDDKYSMVSGLSSRSPYDYFCARDLAFRKPITR